MVQVRFAYGKPLRDTSSADGAGTLLFFITCWFGIFLATVNNNPKKTHFIHANYPKELLFSSSH